MLQTFAHALQRGDFAAINSSCLPKMPCSWPMAAAAKAMQKAF